MNTAHGYHVDGTRLQSANDVEACGGPANCTSCKDEVNDLHIKLKLHSVKHQR